MTCCGLNNTAYNIVESSEAESETRDVNLLRSAPQRTPRSNSRNGLVVCSDAEVRRELAEALRRCDLAPIVVSTIDEAQTALATFEVHVVLCEESVAGTDYRAVVKIAGCVETRIPVIVISRTGNWPEYLAAIRDGAFDYLSYPPVPGEFHRVIRNAVREGEWHHDATRV